MTKVEQLAAFVVRAFYDDLSEAARHNLKIRVLDTAILPKATSERMMNLPIANSVHQPPDSPLSGRFE